MKDHTWRANLITYKFWEFWSGHRGKKRKGASLVSPLSIQIGQKTNLAAGGCSISALHPLLLFLSASWKVPTLPCLHQHTQMLLLLQSQLKSHFLFKTFPNCCSWKWSSPPEKCNSTYRLCIHVVHINPYFRIRKSLNEIVGNSEIYSFMCNSLIHSLVYD